MALIDGLNAAANVVGEFAGSAPNQQMVKLMDALMNVYALELMDVAPEGLLAKQAAIRQVAALRAVLMGDAAASPRI